MENYIQNGNSVKLLRVELFLICFGKKSFQYFKCLKNYYNNKLLNLKQKLQTNKIVNLTNYVLN